MKPVDVTQCNTVGNRQSHDTGVNAKRWASDIKSVNQVLALVSRIADTCTLRAACPEFPPQVTAKRVSSYVEIGRKIPLLCDQVQSIQSTLVTPLAAEKMVRHNE